MSNRLVVQEVYKSYRTGSESLDVLKGASLTAEEGESLAIAGPSGCGKSTLLNIIGSLDAPTSGKVSLGDVEVTSLTGSPLAEYRNRQVGFVFQDHHLLPQCSAIENVLLPTLASRHETQESAARARDLLARVGLEEKADDFPALLSGGERQRIAVARALINRPSLLLCDEPTGNLDADTSRKIVSLFLELVKEMRTTLVVVSHNPEVARRLERTFRLKDGVLEEDGDVSPALSEGEEA